MRSSFLFFSLLIAFSNQVDFPWKKKEVEEEQGLVEVLTMQNFTSNVLNSKEKYFIEFYAPWCGHCKQLLPIFEAVAEQVKMDKLNIKLAKVDITVEKELADLQGVVRFPTLKYYRGGHVSEYEGARGFEELSMFVYRATKKPAATKYRSVEEFLSSHESGFILANNPSETLRSNFETAATLMSDKTGFEISDAPFSTTILKEDENSSPYIVAVERLFGNEPTSVLTNSETLKDQNALSEWLWNRRLPVLKEIGVETIPELMAMGRSVFVVAKDENEKFTEILKSIKSVIRTNSGIRFGILNATISDHFVTSLEIPSYPYLVGLDLRERLLYKFPNIDQKTNTPSKEEILKFALDLADNNIASESLSSFWKSFKYYFMYGLIFVVFLVVVVFAAVFFAPVEPAKVKLKK